VILQLASTIPEKIEAKIFTDFAIRSQLWFYPATNRIEIDQKLMHEQDLLTSMSYSPDSDQDFELVHTYL
jgi:hypothetical protein